MTEIDTSAEAVEAEAARSEKAIEKLSYLLDLIYKPPVVLAEQAMGCSAALAITALKDSALLLRALLAEREKADASIVAMHEQTTHLHDMLATADNDVAELKQACDDLELRAEAAEAQLATAQAALRKIHDDYGDEYGMAGLRKIINEALPTPVHGREE